MGSQGRGTLRAKSISTAVGPGAVVGPALSSEHALDLLVVGHTNIDRFLDVGQLPGPDRTVPLAGYHEALGGTAASLAISAARFGVRTGLVSRIGSEFPDAFRAELTNAHVDISGLTVVRGARTPTCWVLEDGQGQQMTVIDQGAMADTARAKIPMSGITSARWVHLATGDPAFQLRTQAAARRLGRSVSADPAQEVHYRWRARDLRTLLAGSEIVFGNAAEIDAMVGLLGLSGPSELLDLTPLVVVTLGAKGALAYRRGAPPVTVRGSPVRAKRVTGAGDAFRGGFYAGWFMGQPLRTCLRAGVRSARSWLLGRRLSARQPVGAAA